MTDYSKVALHICPMCQNWTLEVHDDFSALNKPEVDAALQEHFEACYDENADALLRNLLKSMN
jgi:hypothetical protein